MLPREREVKHYLMHHYTGDFDRMNALHKLAVKIASGPKKVTRTRGLNKKVLDVATGVYVKACKQFRSIQILCENGLTEDAQALTRNFLETTVSLHFLLRWRVRLVRNGTPLAPVSGKSLTTDFRADLYLANGVLQKEKMLNDWGQTKGLKRAYERVRKTAFMTAVNDARERLGAEWTQRVRRSGSYAGVNFRDLVHSLGASSLYAVLFRMGSQFVHATELSSYVTIKEDGTTVLYLQPHDQWIEPTMKTANMLLCLCMEILNDRFGLGHDIAIAKQKENIGLSKAAT